MGGRGDDRICGDVADGLVVCRYHQRPDGDSKLDFPYSFERGYCQYNTGIFMEWGFGCYNAFQLTPSPHVMSGVVRLKPICTRVST